MREKEMAPHRLSHLRTRLRAVLLGLVAAGAATLLSASAPAEGKDRPYLALGDSVVFGFITQAGFEYVNPDNFVGYPSYVDAALRLEAFNAACPGEATSGFISSTDADNGCRPFRAAFPLHLAYTSTQLEFATGFLQANPNTRLVTIGLGANDIFLLELACFGDPVCIGNGLPQVLATISSNMDTILSGLRATGFHGVLMVVNYYSLDYSDPAGTAGTVLLNRAVTAPAAAHGAIVADVFTAFQAAASTAGGKTCRAGLLNASPQNQFTCDVHPSQSGQQLIAATVEDAFRAALAGAGDGH
jgi:lysophospholipase L1-like esterase